MKRHRRWFLLPALLGLLGIPTFFATRFIILNNASFAAAGTIAEKQSDLMIIAVLLMLLVIVPVLFLVLGFAWYYRANNHKAKYLPDWDNAKVDEFIWWAIPFEIILVLAAITWTTTHDLDQWKPLESEVPPITIQVVSLNWKWLFIYPEEGIATVNELEIPTNTPINFELTADSPMNSFWISQLGGQIMVMTGMVTKIHLDATKEGVYNGVSANYSGKGFAGMNFPVRAVSRDKYDAWITHVKETAPPLDKAGYDTLAEPSKNEPAKQFVLTEPKLFPLVIAKYMHLDMHSTSTKTEEHEMHMEHTMTHN